MHLVGKIERSRVHHVLDAQRAEEVPFAGAGGGENLRAGAPGQRDGRLTDPASRRVDQHPVAWFESC
jgi:hypothetical protein